MHLTYRPAQLADVDDCLAMLRPERDGSPELYKDRLSVWRGWLREGQSQITVLEDGERPRGRRQVAFGSSIFVTDEFLAEAKTSLPPPLSAEIVRRCKGGHSPVLEPKAIRRANSGAGLNLLILHLGWASDLEPEELRRVKGKMLEAMLFFFSGYRINEVVQEIYSTEEHLRAAAVGVRVKNDYHRYYEACPEKMPPPEHRPCLMGSRRDETADGSYLSPLFFYTSPRFFLTQGEQETLCLALLDQADADIAAALAVSPSTVQKRWKMIFERVSAAVPEFFPTEPTPAEAQRRGVEKRRFLLAYLRHHLEELRPHLSPES